MRACSPVRPVSAYDQGQERRVPGHSQIHWNQRPGYIHGVLAMLQPIRRQLLVDHRIPGAGGQLQDKQQT